VFDEEAEESLRTVQIVAECWDDDDGWGRVDCSTEPCVDELTDDMESTRGGRTCRGGGAEASGCGCGMICTCCCMLCDESGWNWCWCSAAVTWLIEGRRCCCCCCCNEGCNGEDEADVMRGYCTT
jgi:hypothetical protein